MAAANLQVVHRLPPVTLRLPVLRGSAWFSCTQPSGYVHDATSRQLERLHRAPPWMEPVDRRRPPRCHVGINPLTHADCEASSLWRGGGRPNIGFNKETPEVGEGGNRQTRLDPFRSQAAGEGVRICAGGCRLPAPVPRSSLRPRLRPGRCETYSWPHPRPGKCAGGRSAVEGPARKSRTKVPALIVAAGAQKGEVSWG